MHKLQVQIHFLLAIFFSSSLFAAKTYEVEKEINDEIFIINGENFEAKTYCMSLEEGDEVIFLEGSPYGACSTAKLFDINSEEVCEVWCE